MNYSHFSSHQLETDLNLFELALTFQIKSWMLKALARFEPRFDIDTSFIAFEVEMKLTSLSTAKLTFLTEFKVV